MSGLFGFKLADDVLDSVRNVDLRADHHVSDEHYGRAVGVVGGKDRNRVERKINVGNDVHHVANKRVGAEHNALALSGRARGVNEQRELSWVKLNVEVGASVLREFSASRCDHSLKAVITVRAEVNDGSGDSRHPHDLLRLCGDLVVDKEIVDVGVLCRVGKIGRAPVLIKRNENCSDEESRIVGYHEAVGHLSDNHNVLSRHSAREHLGCESADVVAKLDVADVDLLLVGGLVSIRERGSVAVGLCGVFNYVANAVKFLLGMKLMLVHYITP